MKNCSRPLILTGERFSLEISKIPSVSDVKKLAAAIDKLFKTPYFKSDNERCKRTERLVSLSEKYANALSPDSNDLFIVWETLVYYWGLGLELCLAQIEAISDSLVLHDKEKSRFESIQKYFQQRKELKSCIDNLLDFAYAPRCIGSVFNFYEVNTVTDISNKKMNLLMEPIPFDILPICDNDRNFRFNVDKTDHNKNIHGVEQYLMNIDTKDKQTGVPLCTLGVKKTCQVYRPVFTHTVTESMRNRYDYFDLEKQLLSDFVQLSQEILSACQKTRQSLNEIGKIRISSSQKRLCPFDYEIWLKRNMGRNIE